MSDEVTVLDLRDNYAPALWMLFDHCDDLLLAVDPEARLVLVNPSVERTLHRPAAELLGLTLAESGIFGRDNPTLLTRVSAVLNRRPAAAGEIVWPRDDGNSSIYHLEVLPERDAGGNIGRVLIRARNVSEQRRIESDLRFREREFRTLAENSPDNIVRYSLDGRAIYVNRQIEQRVRIEVSQMIGRLPTETRAPGTIGLEAYQEQLFRTLRTGEPGTVELQAPHPDGSMRVHSILFAAEHDPTGAICGAVAVGRDVTEEVRIRQAFADKEREFRSLAENAGDHILRWSVDGRMRYLNPAMAGFFGLPLERLLGRTPGEIWDDHRLDEVHRTVLRVAREGQPQMFDMRLNGPSGPAVHQIRLVPERDEGGHVASVLGIGRDITEKIAHLELIESLVRTDPLTGLPNRNALHERASATFAAAGRRGVQVGVMLLDLDEFKSINDGLGHSAGDQLLCEIVRRLSSCLRANDLLARLGGDEFVVLVPDIEHPQLLGTIAEKLHQALAAAVRVAHRDVHVTASVGVAVFPSDGEGLEELLAHADSAMYHAKGSGRARTEYYRRELGDAVQRRLLLEATMRAACSGDGLELCYQPIVDLPGTRLRGAEALLRWRHPTLGMLLPDAFIAVAEQTGMIVPIGHWVLRTAARAAVRWNQNRPVPLRIAVNASTRQFLDDDLAASVQAALEEAGCPPEWLTIEITESALLEDSALVRGGLDALRAHGVGLALDDFGVGYSALNYLARFQFDTLKIDRTFVHGIGHSERESEVVKAFIAMAVAMNLDLVAEGVENDQQSRFLATNGCHRAQGFLFGRPMPPAEFDRLARLDTIA